MPPSIIVPGTLHFWEAGTKPNLQWRLVVAQRVRPEYWGWKLIRCCANLRYRLIGRPGPALLRLAWARGTNSNRAHLYFVCTGRTQIRQRYGSLNAPFLFARRCRHQESRASLRPAEVPIRFAGPAPLDRIATQRAYFEPPVIFVHHPNNERYRVLFLPARILADRSRHKSPAGLRKASAQVKILSGNPHPDFAPIFRHSGLYRSKLSRCHLRPDSVV